MLHYNKENLSLHEPHLFYLFTVQTVRFRSILRQDKPIFK